MSQTYSLAAGWRKSSRCETGHCVEVAWRGGAVAIRNSTAPDQRILVDAEAWRAFVAGLRAGEFDI
jgi:hypothetical protein